MQPYFLTHHIAALLILVTMMAWGMMELSQISQEHRDRARKVGAPVLRIVMLACLAAAVAVVNLVPRLVPVAAIRPGLVSFLVGIVLLLAGLVLRGWSIMTLGEYFTHNVMMSSDQAGGGRRPVSPAAPPQLHRHAARSRRSRPGVPYRAYAAEHKRLVPLVW